LENGPDPPTAIAPRNRETIFLSRKRESGEREWKEERGSGAARERRTTGDWSVSPDLSLRGWFIAALLLLAATCPAANKAGSGLPPGSLAPAFALPDIHGRQVRLDEYRGQIVVLNFWAFWCDTWKAEMPHLQELIPRQEELGFHLVAVSVDGTRLPEFQKCTARSKAPFPVLLDVGGQVCARYKVAHVPTVVIIDRAGRVRYTASGYPGNHVILRELRKLASMNAWRSQAGSLKTGRSAQPSARPPLRPAAARMPLAMSSRVPPLSLSSQRRTFLPYERRTVAPRVVAGGPARTSVVAGTSEAGSRQVGRPQHVRIADEVGAAQVAAGKISAPEISAR
jgi:peroxiredoxin